MLLRRLFSSSASSRAVDVLVVGAGPGGLAVASDINRILPKATVAIADAAQVHYYQPLWTLVGAGIKEFSESRRPMDTLIPKHAEWIQQNVAEFNPEGNSVTFENGEKVKYEYLVVATGIEVNLQGIKGLEETLGDNAVVTNYVSGRAIQTWEWAQRVKENGGNALFTFPSTPVKCAGAPQKIMYLLEDYFDSEGVRDKWNFDYYCAIGKIFGADHYGHALNKICDKRNINRHFNYDLVEVRGADKEAVFRNVQDKSEIVRKFDFLHVTPHMRPVAAVRNSPLANAAGFVDVNKETLQHVKYGNVFSLGDCSSLPTSKTAAAISHQHRILSENLKSVLEGNPLTKKYDGYTSCPLTTAKGRLILAEFDYQMKPLETFWYDQRKESAFAYGLKTDLFPALYWKSLLKGHWKGPSKYRKFFSKFKRTTD